MKKLFSIIALAVTLCSGLNLAAQSNQTDYQLYLTQIAAAEAFLQLNKISTARHYLNSTDKKFRGLEWDFLNANLDQSSKNLTLGAESNYNDVKVSPDGKKLAAAGSDSGITIYQLPDLKIIKKIKGHKGSVTTLAFSSDGRWLASGGRDKQVMVWDAENGNLKYANTTSFSQGIYQVRFSPDSEKLAVVSWERIRDKKPYVFGFAKLLDASTGAEISKIELDNHPASGVVFSPDGQSVIFSTWGEIAYGYDVDSAKQLWTYDLAEPSEYNAFHSIDISPDGKFVVLGATDHRLHVLDAQTGKLIERIESYTGHTKIVKAVSFSPDGKYLATAGEDQTILVWLVDGFTKEHSLIGHTGTVSGLNWSANGETVYSVSLDGSLREWNVKNPFTTSYEICNFGPWQTPVFPDKKRFAAPSSDKKMAVYDIKSGLQEKLLGLESGLCGDISSNGKFLATSSFDGIVRLWDVEKGSEVKSFKGHTTRVDGVAWLNRTGEILSVGDTTLRVWTMNSDSAVRILPLPGSPFRIVMSSDEKNVFIGFSDGSVNVMDTKTWKVTQSFKAKSGIQEMLVSPKGKWLALFTGKNIELRDTKNLKKMTVLSGHEKSGYGIGFSDNEKYLISGSDDQTFKLWSLTTMTCTLTYHGYEDVIYNSKIISDHEIMVSTSQGKIRYYNLKKNNK